MRRLLAIALTFVQLLALMNVVLGETNDLTKMDVSELVRIYGDVLAEIGRRSLVSKEGEASTEKPILFRNIEWGTSATDFLAAM